MYNNENKTTSGITNSNGTTRVNNCDISMKHTVPAKFSVSPGFSPSSVPPGVAHLHGETTRARTACLEDFHEWTEQAAFADTSPLLQGV